MKKLTMPYKIAGVLLLVTALIITACSVVPITGRRQISLVSDSEVTAMAFSQYSQFLQENPLSTNKAQTAMVKGVGQNIAAAVERYFVERGLSVAIATFQWEFTLVAADTPTPGACP